MEVTINYNGQAVAVEVTLEVYEFLDRVLSGILSGPKPYHFQSN